MGVKKKFITRWEYKYQRKFNNLKSSLCKNEIYIPEELSEDPSLVYHKHLAQSIIDVFDLFSDKEKRKLNSKVAKIKKAKLVKKFVKSKKNKIADKIEKFRKTPLADRIAKLKKAQIATDTSKTQIKKTFITANLFNKKLKIIKVNLEECIHNSSEIVCCRSLFKKSYRILNDETNNNTINYEVNTLKKSIYKDKIDRLNEKLKELDKNRKKIANVLNYSAVPSLVDEICLTREYRENTSTDNYTKKKKKKTIREYADPYHKFFNKKDVLYRKLKKALLDDIAELISEKFLQYKHQVNKVEQEIASLEAKITSISKFKTVSPKENLDKVFARPWVFRFYFELIKFIAVQSGKKDFIDAFVKESKEKFESKDLSYIEKEMLIIKQFYASTLGIFGLTKRDLSLFKPKNNNFILNFDGNNKKDFNSYNKLMKYLTQISCNLGCAHFDADIDEDKIAALFKLFACMSTLNKTFYNYDTSTSNLYITKEAIEELTTIKLRRLTSNSNNRIDNSFNLSTFFKNLNDTDNIKETRILSIILGNLIEDISSVEKDMNTTFISPSKNLANFDKKIAKCFCLLDWDKDEILDAIVKAHQKVH